MSMSAIFHTPKGQVALGTPLEVQRTANSICLCFKTALVLLPKASGATHIVLTGPHCPQSWFFLVTKLCLFHKGHRWSPPLGWQ